MIDWLIESFIVGTLKLLVYQVNAFIIFAQKTQKNQPQSTKGSSQNHNCYGQNQF